MRTILLLIQKEIIQIFRNRSMLPILFVMPLVQLLVLVHAATFEMKHIRFYSVDPEPSSLSREIIGKMEASPFFVSGGNGPSFAEAEKHLMADEVHIILQFEPGFEKAVRRDGSGSVLISINAINGSTAGLIAGYTQSILQDFNRQMVLKTGVISGTGKEMNQEIRFSHWYNPELDYKSLMVPGILVILVTVIGMFISGMNLVREKEMGTIEQINVTPIRKYQFIAGKLIPIWLIALLELGIGLSIGKLLFHIPMLGSLPLLFLVAGVYLLVVLGLGLFMSTITDTQQQAMFIAWFFMLIFVLMSGLFTSVDHIPQWAKAFNLINPVVYFMNSIRMILLKGSGLVDIFPALAALSVYALLILSLSVWRYRKTT